MLRRLLALVSAVAFFFAGLWGLAAILRLIFGIRVALPLIPAFGLDHVEIGSAFAMALGFTFVGAITGRVSSHVGRSRAAAQHSVPVR